MIALSLALDAIAEPDVLAELLAVGAPLRLPSLWASLTLAYLGAGASMAWHLARRGHSLGTASAALACWPLFVGLIGRRATGRAFTLDEPTSALPGQPGPLAPRIDACVLALRHELLRDEVLRNTAPITLEQLDKLGLALHRADRRVAHVDRLIAEAEASARGSVSPQGQAEGLLGALASLRQARDHARGELEAALSGLLQLRVQLGLFTLAGGDEPVRERLEEIEARVAALAELSSLYGARTP
ncbi:hypothetical protein G6O69_26150 [Pseudenhygromyxa sp. WMMC2535]|uniref:hypothetical protein n=1 Tax=Pseudenhygromyxa sp. WMMC2535 TaxID=2712867 RepID=UPI00155672FC|nr:hypothetical protein [Pseudenhygromyxa sp. WMMC2535]NVB41347.1 hypothetical protein [Pseudenhygromyxa sp. WMMC2535]